MPTINPTLPPDTRTTGSGAPAADVDQIVDALITVISAVNAKVETINGKTGLTITLNLSDLSGAEIPNYYNYTTGAYPTRPTVSGVVIWVGPSAPPTSGTGSAVENVSQPSLSDRWLIIP